MRLLLDPDLGRQARVDPAIDLADVGDRVGPAGADGQRLLDHDRAEPSLPLEMASGGGEQTAPPRRPAGDVEELHRREDQRERPTEVEVAGIAADRLDGQAALGGPLRERRQDRRVGVDGGHRMSGGGQRQRDPPGPGAEVEDAAGELAGEPREQLEVGREAAVLGVVPGDRIAAGRGPGGASGAEPRGHRQNSVARPRFASRVRSSISAV